MSEGPGAYPRFRPVPLRQLEEASPSRAHGVDWEKELNWRKVSSGLIYHTACGPSYLKLLNFTAARAVALFNRFYTRVSFERADRWHVAPACILLASKIDNSPRTAKDVATAFFVARCGKKHRQLIHNVHDPAWVAAEVEALVAAERALLFALNFDFKVDIPDAWVLPAVRALGVPVPRHGQAAAGPGEAAAQDVVTKTYCLLTSSWTHKDTITLCVNFEPEAIGKAALLVMCALCGYQLPLPPGESFAEKFAVPADTLIAIAQRLQLCFAPGTPGSKLTEAQLRESALRPTPAQPPQAPGAAAPTPGAAAGAGGAAPAAPAAAADSPPGAHDSASSHQLMGGTALASRKRALGGGGGAVAPEREPLLKPAPQAHGQGQQQQQPADGATSAEAAAKRVRA